MTETRPASDRTVHGYMADETPIVRYNRSGKWYIEPAEGPRRQVNIAAAARSAILGRFIRGLPGGRAFDRLVESITKEARA